MKRLLPTTALSIALAALTVGFVAPSSVYAAKKDDKKAAEAGGPKLTLSKEFQPNATAIQALIAAKDFAGAKAKMTEIQATATKPDDQYYLGNFYLQTGLGLKDEGMQRAGLEKMLASGLAPAAEATKYHYFVGQFALNAKDYPAAREQLTASATGGYEPVLSEVFIAETYFSEANAQIVNNQFTPAGKALVAQGLPHLKKAVDAQAASGQPVDPKWYTRGFKMASFTNDPSMGEWAKLSLSKDGTPENWRIALRTLQDANSSTSTKDQSLDILRLMAVTNSLQSAFGYNEYAETAWKAGLPGEVKSGLDYGKARGEIDLKEFDLYNTASNSIAKDKASLPASEKAAAAAPTGSRIVGIANAHLGYGDYAKAIELYNLGLTKGGVDADEVNTRIGIALARSGDKAGAVASFAKVTKPGLRKQIADLWALWAGSTPVAA